MNTSVSTRTSATIPLVAVRISCQRVSAEGRVKRGRWIGLPVLQERVESTSNHFGQSDSLDFDHVIDQASLLLGEIDLSSDGGHTAQHTACSASRRSHSAPKSRSCAYGMRTKPSAAAAVRSPRSKAANVPHVESAAAATRATASCTASYARKPQPGLGVGRGDGPASFGCLRARHPGTALHGGDPRPPQGHADRFVGRGPRLRCPAGAAGHWPAPTAGGVGPE